MFLLFSLFLFYRSIDLLQQLYYSNPIDYSFGETLFIALLINLLIVGIFVFPGYVLPTSKLMPKRYWQLKNPPLLNYLFSALGVNTYKSILVLLFWGKKSNQKKYYNGTREGLEKFNFQTKQSEFGHICALIIIVIASLFLLFKDYYLLALFITLFNIIVNLYPVILQRHHRIRIFRLAKLVHG